MGLGLNSAGGSIPAKEVTTGFGSETSAQTDLTTGPAHQMWRMAKQPGDVYRTPRPPLEVSYPSQISNWMGDIASAPLAVVHAKSVDDVVEVMKNISDFPGPVRAVGSNHSTTQAAVAERGTVIDMRAIDHIKIDKKNNRVTVGGGAFLVDVVASLRAVRLQLPINVEIGALTMGSAACCATKDSSMPGPDGRLMPAQYSSYVTRMKIVTPKGEVRVITEENDPDLMRVLRSSYGLLGVVVEATFETRPLKPLQVRYQNFSISDFRAELPALLRNTSESMMFYIFPFRDSISIELRKELREDIKSIETSSWQWRLRNFMWSRLSPTVGNLISKAWLPNGMKNWLYNRVNDLTHLLIPWLGGTTVPSNQVIRYPAEPPKNRYTFSMWAFPEKEYADVLGDYVEFCKQYQRETGYRHNLISVGYRIAGDNKGLFSYSSDGNVMSVDPVSTANPGWDEFLKAYNAFCARRGGKPLFNQTKWLTPEQVRGAFGERIDEFHRVRSEMDPDDRMLNPYFTRLLG